ncbi:hypothetical protein [Sphingorhabdus sp. M41]|uniref:hypothetical protein n=1 Tax=Sphingorhabdus sp. M41 TaxID=1806885 RepID=UPI0018D44CA5|nr:hypothetical protein [Sphingorhabdus sp. M41]
MPKGEAGASGLSIFLPPGTALPISRKAAIILSGAALNIFPAISSLGNFVPGAFMASR